DARSANASRSPRGAALAAPRAARLRRTGAAAIIPPAARERAHGQRYAGADLAGLLLAAAAAALCRLGNRAAPPLVLLHGGRDHCRNWDWVAARLRHAWHVIAPDLR